MPIGPKGKSSDGAEAKVCLKGAFATALLASNKPRTVEVAVPNAFQQPLAAFIHFVGVSIFAALG